MFNEAVSDTADMPVDRKIAERRLGLSSLLLVLAALLIVPWFVKHYFVFQLTIVLAYGMAIMGLNILTGVTGQVSIGQGAFFAIGAYVTAILMDSFSASYVIGLPVAGLVCFVIGFLFGFPALRLRGTYLALATFALAAATPHLLKLHFLDPWTGGVGGIFLVAPDAPLGLPLEQDLWLYYLTLAIYVVFFVTASNLLRSRSGRAMMATRDNAIAASALGVNTGLYRTLAFGISAGMTGVAGGLSALAVQFVATDAFPILLSIGIFVGMVIGGASWLPGALLGGAFMVFVPNIAESISKGLSGAVYGVLLFVAIFLLPHGAQQVADFVKRRLVGRGG